MTTWRLVNSIQRIVEEDPKHPRTIRVLMDGKSDMQDSNVEFDTIESAREWRRELQGKKMILCPYLLINQVFLA